MANWIRVANGSTAGNISMNVDIGIQSVTRTSNSNVRVVYGVRFSMATSTYTYNSVAAFCPKGGTRYYAFGGNGHSHTISGTWYYADKTTVSTTTTEVCPFTIDIPVSISQTRASFEVGYGWNSHTPSENGSSVITVDFPTGATVPTGCWCSASAVDETTINLSGGYGSNGGAGITGSGFQYSTNQSNWSNCGSTFTGSANTTYYFRYYATNSQGTSYSGNTSATTYNYPYISSPKPFTIGSYIKMNLYNPLGRNCAIYIKGNDDSVICTGSRTTGGDIEISSNSSEITAQYKSIPNSKSGTYKVILVCTELNRDTTVNGNTYSIKNDGTENPTFGVGNIIDVVDTLNVSITGDNKKFIKGHNTLTGKITPMSSNYYANLDYYSISATGLATQTKNYSTSNISFTLNNINTNSFVVNAVDKRTLSTPATKSITLINYDNPTLTEAVITRQNGTGTYIDVYFKGNYTNWQGLKQNNTVASAKYRYKKVGNSTWSSWVNIPTSAIKNTNGVWEINTTFDTVFSNTDKYDLELSITDKLETISFTGLVVSTANALIWKDLQNKRVGIGKKPEYVLDVNGDINTNGNFRINGKPIVSSGVITSELGCVGKAYYYHICHIKKLSHIQGNMYGIRLYEGNGNNSTSNQNTYTEIIFQDGWTGSNSGRPGVTCEYHNLLTSTYTREIIVTYSDNNNYDVWIKGIGIYTRPNYIPMYNPKYIEITDTSKDGSETPPSDANKLNVSVINSSLSSYPIGSIYLSATATSPASLFGGTWTQLKNRFLFATNSTSGNKGKDAVSSHTGTNVTGTAISIDQMPAHTHNAGLNNAGGHIHNFWFGGGANSGNGGQIPVANSRWGQDNAGQTNGAHDHGGVWVANSGGGKTHNHSVSYIEVYVWQRTA